MTVWVSRPWCFLSGCRDPAASPAGLSLCPPSSSSIPTNPRLGLTTPSPHWAQRASLAGPSCLHPVLLSVRPGPREDHSCHWGIDRNSVISSMFCARRSSLLSGAAPLILFYPSLYLRTARNPKPFWQHLFLLQKGRRRTMNWRDLPVLSSTQGQGSSWFIYICRGPWSPMGSKFDFETQIFPSVELQQEGIKGYSCLTHHP